MRQLTIAREEFVTIFGEEAEFYGEAPGRAEILGNHTDYNDGLVLAAAIDRSIVVAGRPIPGDTSRVYSLTFKAGSSFKTSSPEYSKSEHWLNYLMSMVWQFRQIGLEPPSFEAIIAGDVPLGAGLSSSAAMEMAVGNFIKAILGVDMAPMDMALNGRAAENGFVGVQCGILDQWSSVMGREDSLLLLDCRKLEVLDYPSLPQSACLVIADTNAPHSLMTGEYNQRRESCARAAKVCAEKYPHKSITHLRDVTLEELEGARDAMSDEDFRRARHIVTENLRTLAGADALRQKDLVALGRLFTESHASSQGDFENSGPELDAMVEAANGLPGFYGARLSGGGFGGATVNLVDAAEAEGFCRALRERYRSESGLKGETYVMRPSAGARGGAFQL